MSTAEHIIILPYFSEQEVDRYLQIAARLQAWRRPDVDVRFLLASSPKIRPSDRLLAAFEQLGSSSQFACPTHVFGYPEGPTAMYWDAMEHVAQRYSESEGFCLWLESDMAPIKEDWIDRLSHEWFTGSPPLMMGCHVPDIYKHRPFRRPKLILHEHVNGGACYAKDFARRLPARARRGVFDMAVYRYAMQQNGVRATEQIAFSTMSSVRRDVQSPTKVLLHGFMQDKNAFIEACLRPISDWEKKAAAWHPIHESLERLRRRFRVQFIRRGHRAMLENMLLTKQQQSKNAA